MISCVRPPASLPSWTGRTIVAEIVRLTTKSILRLSNERNGAEAAYHSISYDEWLCSVYGCNKRQVLMPEVALLKADFWSVPWNEDFSSFLLLFIILSESCCVFRCFLWSNFLPNVRFFASFIFRVSIERPLCRVILFRLDWVRHIVVLWFKVFLGIKRVKDSC